MDNYNYIYHDMHLSGIMYYDENNEWHRTDGPAIDMFNGDYSYYIHGKRHRLDGPAMCVAGKKCWWINGKMMGDMFHDWAAHTGIDLDNVTEDDQIVIGLKWSQHVD